MRVRLLAPFLDPLNRCLKDTVPPQWRSVARWDANAKRMTGHRNRQGFQKLVERRMAGNSGRFPRSGQATIGQRRTSTPKRSGQCVVCSRFTQRRLFRIPCHVRGSIWATRLDESSIIGWWYEAGLIYPDTSWIVAQTCCCRIILKSFKLVRRKHCHQQKLSGWHPVTQASGRGNIGVPGPELKHLSPTTALRYRSQYRPSSLVHLTGTRLSSSVWWRNKNPASNITNSASQLLSRHIRKVNEAVHERQPTMIRISQIRQYCWASLLVSIHWRRTDCSISRVNCPVLRSIISPCIVPANDHKSARLSPF